MKSEMTEKGNVPNYGYALSPYVLSLSLFVGALVLNVIYPIRKTFSEQESAIRWWLSKASVAGVAAFMQATIFDVGDGVFLRANSRASSAFHRGNLSDVVCVYVDCVAFGDCFGQSGAIPSDGSFGASIGLQRRNIPNPNCQRILPSN